MKYAVPMYAPAVVNAAGKALKNFEVELPSGEMTLDVINNWRASHNHVLNVFYVTMSNRAKRVWPGALTAQRIKRLESIMHKLVREDSMKLSQMQDIGGCRAVVRSMWQLRALIDIYDSHPLVHPRTGMKDYLINPKADGYRGVHLIYRYSGKGPKQPYTGMRVEIQLRTEIQHIWATAVEAAGTFTKQALKSNQGRPEWLRFFACMSSYFALREGCPPVPGTPIDSEELRKEVSALNQQLHVVTILQSYTVTAKRVGEQVGMKYFLVHLDPHAKTVEYRGFRDDQSAEANLAYTELERQLGAVPDAQAVLVSVDSINALKRAYPNYFLDTTRFVREVENLIAGNFGRRVRVRLDD